MLRPAFILLLCLLLPSPALAEKRVALLIGNQSYPSEIGRLANPHNDIALLEKALKGLGFEVSTVRDAGLAALQRAVNAYARRVRAAGPNAVGFFYYAGHGAADAGTNYLIPVDAASVEEGELWDQSLRLTEITRKLKVEAGNATHFVVFDACRNNLKLRTAGSRALVQSRGFVSVVQESGMLVAYATAEGELASDVGSGAGPYASVLAEEIVKPGVEAVEMFRRVQRRVRAAIKQEPYLGFSALGDVYLAGLAPDPPKAPAAPGPAASAQPSEAERAWGAAKGTTSIATLEAFIRRFGDTYYGDLAKVRLAELKQPEAATQAAEATKKKDDQFGPGRVFRDCPDCPEMVVVPPGEFTMGSNDYESEKPPHKVTIPRSFAVGMFEVTFAEWDACVAANGCKRSPDDEHRGRGRRPVTNVSWHDAKEYVDWLSRKTGKTYRLLSEAEWEYAARAGTTTRYAFGGAIAQSEARYKEDEDNTFDQAPVAVGSFPANKFGLHDLHGNVWEWCEDNWHPDYQGAPIDGSVRSHGNATYRVLRSGSANSTRVNLRSANRRWDLATKSDRYVGFRLARTL